VITEEELAEMEARAQSATGYTVGVAPQDEDAEDAEYYQCPLCNGEGDTEALFLAPEKGAAYIGAFGIGRDLHLAEAWVKHGAADTLRLIAELRALKEKKA